MLLTHARDVLVLGVSKTPFDYLRPCQKFEMLQELEFTASNCNLFQRLSSMNQWPVHYWGPSGQVLIFLMCPSIIYINSTKLTGFWMFAPVSSPSFHSVPYTALFSRTSLDLCTFGILSLKHLAVLPSARRARENANS